MKRHEVTELIFKRLGPVGISELTCEEVVSILEKNNVLIMESESPTLKDIIEDLISKDYYLQKGEEVIGLHAVGEEGPYIYRDLDGKEYTKYRFHAFEQWGNNYNKDFQMIGRGSFRLFGDIDEAAKEMTEDGWIQIPGPLKESV